MTDLVVTGGLFRTPVVDNQALMTVPWQRFMEILAVTALAGANTMPGISQVLWQGVYLLDTLAVVYTSGGVTTFLDKVTLVNTSAASVNVTLYLAPAGVVATPQHRIMDTHTIAAHGSDPCTDVIGHLLNPGDTLQGMASATGVISIRGSGRRA